MDCRPNSPLLARTSDVLIYLRCLIRLESDLGIDNCDLYHDFRVNGSRFRKATQSEMQQLLNHKERAVSNANAVGIASISYYQPDWSLPNAWYEPNMPRKFAKHTGIQARTISEEDEVEMAVRVVGQLRQELHRQPIDCAALIFVCPSLIPQSVARRYYGSQTAKQEHPNRVARRLVDRLEIAPRSVIGINSFCSGYARAISLVLGKLNARQELEPNECILVVTSNRISRITDYGCNLTGALFGDMATVSLIARCDSPKFAVQFEIVDASYRKETAAKSFFNFEC